MRVKKIIAYTLSVLVLLFSIVAILGIWEIVNIEDLIAGDKTAEEIERSVISLVVYLDNTTFGKIVEYAVRRHVRLGR